jgi:hypothetical protein
LQKSHCTPLLPAALRSFRTLIGGLITQSNGVDKKDTNVPSRQ